MRERQIKTKLEFLEQEVSLAEKENKQLKTLLSLNK
jgi:cell shape-determining protein MreC